MDIRHKARSVRVNSQVALTRAAAPVTNVVSAQREQHRQQVTAKMAELHERDVERQREQEAEKVSEVPIEIPEEIDFDEALGKIIKAVTKR